MPPAPPPNDRLAALAAILGEADTRELVELFLGSLPRLLGEVGGADRGAAERAAHSLKSSAKQMGLSEIARRMAGLEERFRSNGPLLDPPEGESLARELAEMAEPLRAYVTS